MNTIQQITLLNTLHNTALSERESTAKSLLAHFRIPADKIVVELDNILSIFNNGIGKLNPNQFKNLKDLIAKKYISSEVENKLKFYQIDSKYYPQILNFFENYKATNTSYDVSELDAEFEGVQVATRDDFNKIINDGYTGDWVLTPEKVNPRRVQIASMNDKGSFTRGWYINADITHMTPHKYESVDDKGNIKYITRFRIFISNPKIVYSGNPNVKFAQFPVVYIQRDKL